MSKKLKITFEVQFDRDDEAADPINDPKQYVEDRGNALAEALNDALESYDFFATFSGVEIEQ